MWNIKGFENDTNNFKNIFFTVALSTWNHFYTPHPQNLEIAFFNFDIC